MKKITTLLIALATFQIAVSQCVIEPWSLQKQVYSSDLIVEGEVVRRYSFWDADHQNIYTANVISVYKLFAGDPEQSEIELITEGGQVGMVMHRSNPSLQVEQGQYGVFMLRNNTVALPDQITDNPLNEYQPTASVQSFIRYNEDENIAYGYYQVFEGIGSLLIPKIESYTERSYEVIRKRNEKNPMLQSLSAPILDSLSRDTVTAGTGSKITIYGKNFGFAQGSSGEVMFTDPNYGDGRFYDQLKETNYISWSDKKIEVIVPTRAGTGKIKVVNASGESNTSTFKLTIAYAHLNVLYANSSLGIDTAYFQIDQIDLNGKGGYTWHFNTLFKSNFNAVNAFLRSLENWRCGTLMNWDIGKDTSLNATADDDVNIVRWTKFNDSRLGVCWSRFGGCFSSGPTVTWFVNELDIEFDSGRSWYFGEGTTPNSQFDFESVSTHELGHGHQMGHVIDNKKIMHYSIGKGQRKTTLHPDDVACGVYIRDKSKVKNPCGPGPIQPIKQADCNITRPKAKFTATKTVACPGDQLTFTNASEGVVKSYSWDFGAGNSPATANAEGPHKVTFNNAGTYQVTLIVSNDFGKDTSEIEITVNPATPDQPGMFAPDTLLCAGQYNYMINSVDRATSYQWALPDGGGSFVGSSTDTSVNVDWNTKGDGYRLQITATNSCGTSAPQEIAVDVRLNVLASFTHSDNGRNVNFTNASQNGDSYVWRFGDGDTSVDNDPAHEYAQAGIFAVTLEVVNECSEDDTTVNVQVFWGVGIEHLSGPRIGVQPNPAKDNVSIDLEAFTGKNTSVEIVDVTGKVIWSDRAVDTDQLNVDIRSFAPGVYMIQVVSGDLKSSERLVISRD